MNIDIKNIITSAGLRAIEIIDVMQYDHDMHSLRSRLSYLEGKEFAQDERLFFIHNDTEFIINNLRFTLYNLQKLLADLRIPNYFCVIISQQDIGQDLEHLRKTLTNDPFTIALIDFECYLLFFLNQQKVDVDLMPEKTRKHFILLNRTVRPHRDFLIQFLLNEKLVDNGFISNLRYTELKTFNNNDDSLTNNNGYYITVNPFSRVNDGWKPSDLSLVDIRGALEPFKNFEEDSDISLHMTNVELMQKSFCFVASETVFDYPNHFTSEKSFKSHKAMRPMLMLGAPNNLARIREKGFQTYMEWWDESYDSENDPDIRFNQITKIIKWMCGLPMSRCKEILIEMSDVLKHNKQHYENSFFNQEIKSLHTQLLKNRHR